MTHNQFSPDTATARRAFLVGIDLPAQRGVLDIEASLEELGLLADTAGLEVVGQVYQRLRHPDPATFIGPGKVEEVCRWVEELDAGVVLFDDELSPRHQRELERALGEQVRVLDRTALILDIFAQHARTREGSLQVTLAQYEYRLPRLTRQWTHLARQAGGGSARGGVAGVGLRGPGETQLETDRREIRRIIRQLRHELEKVRAHRERHRARRRKEGLRIASLVGYTNAGKSTLLNQLASADVWVADQLFATLDPTTRRIDLGVGGDVLLTDTVGFIQKLPHALVAAFRATLEELSEADLLLHVVDVTHPNVMDQIAVVERTLREELQVGAVPMLMVLNKIDRARQESEYTALEQLQASGIDSVAVSALTGEGMDELRSRVRALLSAQRRFVTVHLPYSRGDLIALFRKAARVESEEPASSGTTLAGWLEAKDYHLFEQYKHTG